MEHQQRFAWLFQPVVRIISVWLWVIVGPLLLALCVLLVLHVDLTAARRAFAASPYLATYIEMLAAGLLPVVFTLLSKEDLARYGLQSRGWLKSVALSALVILATSGFSYLSTGQWVSFASPSAHLSFPWNIWYAVLGVFAYGPLEVFFVIWLVANTDRVCKSEQTTASWGLLVTVLLFGVLHLFTTQSISTALVVSSTFFLLGLIYKYTANSLGPMLAWTVINGQVWFLAQLLWS